MKAYFNIDGLFDALKINNGNTVQLALTTLDVDGSSVLTADFFTEVIPTFVDPNTSNNYLFGVCSQNGTYPNTTIFDSCAIGSLPNSWNPFVNAFLVNYDTDVDGLARGAILDTISGNPYGIEDFGFGFDKVVVPVNDVTGGGSTGASLPGAFWLDIDFSKSFQMILDVEVKNSSGTTIYHKEHDYTHDPDDCLFNYTSTDLLTTTPSDKTQLAFLSGGIPGWVTALCNPGGVDETCDPIVTQSICVVPSIPINPNTLTAVNQGCCYVSPVLALDGVKDWENDISAFIEQRNFSSETITFVLEKNGGAGGGGSDLPLLNNDYGIFFDFGSLNTNQKGYQIQWYKVLALEGEANYQIKITLALVSGTIVKKSIPFKLKTYSTEEANGTFRVQSIQNGYLKHINFNFQDLNWKDGLRVRGFFGNRQATYEKENIIYTNRKSKQVRNELINEYVMQTMPIPDCITDSIIEYHALANYLIMSDYNLNNHKYTYINKEVVYEGNENIDYNNRSRYVPIFYKFRDYVQDYQKLNC